MGYLIFESKMNHSDNDSFDYYHSEIGFNNKEFSKDVVYEMGHIGITIEELAKATYIASDRLSILLRGNIKYNSEEIKSISKILHITL